MTLSRVLPEFQDFLLSRKIVPEKYVPFYAHWVRKFLAFSNKNRQLDQDALIADFLYSLKSKKYISDWQVRQAEEALRLYLHHFGGSKTIREVQGEARNGVNIREVQDLLGHKSVETTMIYTHVLRDMKNAPQSPLDALYGDRG
jgi:integrase